MKKLALLSAAAIMSMAVAAPAMAEDDPADFVTQASQGNAFEIESSKIALERSKNPAVRAFAQMMIDDHTAATAELRRVAGASPIAASSDPLLMLTEDQREDLDGLRKADEEDFDDDYAELQVSAHHDAVDLFDDYADDGENAELRSFAALSLPTLRTHRNKIEELEDALDVVPSGDMKNVVDDVDAKPALSADPAMSPR